jgi:hypothetical protein
VLNGRHVRHTSVLPALLIAVAVACGGGGSDGDIFGGSGSATDTAASGASTGTNTGAGTGNSASGTGGTGTASSGSASGGGIKYDVGGGGTATTTGDGMMGCDKVDFLFVLDNSVSMGDEQQNLATSFPSFIQTIQADVVGDWHVMVVDTDPEDKWDEELAECPAKCQGEPPTDPCGVIPPQTMWQCGALPTPDVCDAQVGAGVDHDGTDARMSCGLAGGRRWFDQAQTDPAGTFDCVANLYAGNSPELTMGAMLASVGPTMVGVGGCNEGFLRDDAVLVVTFITDEEDNGDSAGDPTSWHDDLLALKGGNQTGIVVLGLLGDTSLPNAVCPPDSMPGSTGGEYSPRLIQFVESWGTRGLWGSVCAPDYSAFFEQAVALVHTACDDFVPPG